MEKEKEGQGKIKLRVLKNYPSPGGMLYKGDIVLLPKIYESYANSSEKIRVEDLMGRLHVIEATLLKKVTT